MRVILAGDIGGTKTRLAIIEVGSSARMPSREARYRSRDYPSLEALVTAFLAGSPGAVPSHAAFGIAGPVVDGRCETTNLPWTVDARSLGSPLGGAQVTLINDLAATGHGLALLGDAELETLQTGSPRPGNRALIAAGTGLGEALLTPAGGGWEVLASEGGHADFGPRDALEDALLGWLRERYGHVSYERVLSGHGFADLYRFLSERGIEQAPAGFDARLAEADDPAPLIAASALDDSNPRARAAVERFVSIYGAEAGNLALKGFAVGGVYVGGGIAPRIARFMRDGAFVRAFGDKGRLVPVLAAMPLTLVLEDRCALWGAASLALRAAAGPPA